MKVSIDDEKIVQMNLQGLKKMILYRIKQITADICRSCNKVVHYQREIEYNVSCWECGRGACPDCYPTNISGGKNWRFLCQHCLEVIGNLRGFKALQETDLLKVKKPKKTPKVAEEPTKDDDEKNEEDTEAASLEDEGENESQNDSCAFTADVATQENGENVEEDPNSAFVEQRPRGFKSQNRRDETTENEKPNENPNVNEKKEPKTCTYFLQGRCHWGMSGKKPRKNVPDAAKECPYAHPRVCAKLLHHGDGKHTKYGCDGTNCRKAHPKMCTTSMRNRKCGTKCKRGFHLKGTTFEDEIPVQQVSKNVQTKYNIENSHQFPTLSQMQQKRTKQGPTEQTHRNEPQPDLSVPPPKVVNLSGNNFICMDCPAEFKYKHELKNHHKAQHNHTGAQNEASFLDVVQKSLNKMLPRLVENAIIAIQNKNQTNQTGNNMQNMRWGLIPANLS